MSEKAVCDLCKKAPGDRDESCQHWCDKRLVTEELKTTHEKQIDT